MIFNLNSLNFMLSKALKNRTYFFFFTSLGLHKLYSFFNSSLDSKLLNLPFEGMHVPYFVLYSFNKFLFMGKIKEKKKEGILHTHE